MVTKSKIKFGAIWLPFFSILMGIGLSSSAPKEADLVVGNFRAGSLKGWKEKSFKNTTVYKLVKGDKEMVLMADSNDSASGLYREITVDLAKKPCLTWSWKVDRVLEGLDETTKNGDDFPVRVYVIFSGGVFFWKTRALNYVWSNGLPKGSAWKNAHTMSSINISVQSGLEKVGQWTQQTRNVRRDYKRFFGSDVKQADAVAIMTDTDNSGSQAIAFYGDISFSSKC